MLATLSVAMHSVFRRFAPILCAAALCQCGAPQPPQCRRVPWASREPAAALLLRAHHDWAILGDGARRAEWASAQVRYNAAVAKLFDQLRCGSRTWDQRAAVLGTRIPAAGLHETHPSTLDAVFPAAKVSTRVVKSRQITTGVGVPLVGWKHSTPVSVPRERFLLPNGIPHILTATLDFNAAGAPAWHFTRRWLHEDLQIGRTRHVLAADWSAPNAFFWHMCDLDDLKIQNVIVPERYMEETGVYFVGPYDPEKIPLVFVHGLVSSPDAFKNMINELAPEPWFRAHYQIWLYNYPTGNPWLLSSMKFREVMRGACAYARTRGHDRNLRRMVVVAHSMGGLLTRSSVTDPKTVLYDARFKQPPNTLKVSATAHQLIRESLLYQPLREPQRVVFLAVPHRGSPSADWRVSLWLSRLVRLPKTLTVGFLTTSLQVMGDVMHGENPSPHIPTSINSLSPNNKSTRALNQLPLPGRVTFHSIIGDRGRGDTPHSSDGVVPYGSSHVTPVASELIVPSNHSVPNNPEAARELKRILQLHLQDRK
jgi:hypothetical protein